MRSAHLRLWLWRPGLRSCRPDLRSCCSDLRSRRSDLRFLRPVRSVQTAPVQRSVLSVQWLLREPVRAVRSLRSGLRFLRSRPGLRFLRSGSGLRRSRC